MAADAVDRDRLIAHFEQRLERDPHARAFVPLADLYRKAGRHDDARRVLTDGVAQHPNFVSALVALGRLLDELGEGQTSRSLLERALARDPDNLVALRLLATGAEGRGDWPAATAHLERLARLDPDDLLVHDRLRDARRHAADMAPATTVPPPAESLLAADPGAGVATLTLADLFLRQGHRDQARRILQQLAAAAPGRQDVQERLAALDGDATGGPAPAAAAATAAASEAQQRQRIHRRTSTERQVDHERFQAWVERASQDDSGL
jgi:tetratricopeptide (TPR) repeat protein